MTQKLDDTLLGKNQERVSLVPLSVLQTVCTYKRKSIMELKLKM